MGDRDDDEAAEDPALDKLLAETRPEADAVTRAVWFARVAKGLFGTTRPVAVGRYQLDRQLGRGGGGSVFVATDPELHRDVAIKLIRSTSDAHRERALAEGRALAKLSHPNVVPVHDVGEADGYVYIVMELLRGASLRELAAAPERSLRAVIDAYRQAASGLAAAHAVSLVHRDFKPDNAMLGGDGRVRVVDFGLAIGADSTESAATVGTPRYMAPEQRDGRQVGTAVDQYALGASLREAAGAMPAWLGRVVARATAEDPADRYPSMEALAQALGDDPRTRWKRRVWIGAPLALAIAGFWIGRGASAAATVDERCSGGAEALAPAWTAARAEAAVAHIAGLGSPLAAAITPLVRERATAFGRRWLAAQRASCAAHERGTLSHELYDRATVCLARSRIGLGEAMQVLEGATAAQLDVAMQSIAAVDSPEPCADPIALATEANPQPTPSARAIDHEIEIAAVHARAATGQAVELARRAAAAARNVGDHRLLARALLVQGQALFPDYDRAVAPLHEAMLLAMAEGLDDVATEAYARHAFALGRKVDGDLRHALEGVDLVTAFGRRAVGDRGLFARALLHNNIGSLALTAGDLVRARRELAASHALAERVTGPGAVELMSVVSNLATVSPDRAVRDQLFTRALDQTRKAVGPGHSQTLAKEVIAILDRVDPATVVRELTDVCSRYARLHPALERAIETCAFELAWQAHALGDAAAARLAASLGRTDGRREHPRDSLNAAYAALAGGGDTSALVAPLAAVAQQETAKIDDKGWYQRIRAADVELAVASLARAAGRPRDAATAAQRASDQLELTLATGLPYGKVLRRLAWARELLRRVRAE